MRNHPPPKSPEDAELAALNTDEAEVLAELLLDAEEAREDPAKFLEFVMREEQTGDPITCIPLQQLIFEFIEWHRNAVLMIPVDHTKTFTVATYATWKLGHDPSLKGAFVSASEGQAMKPLRQMRQYIEESQEQRFVFPELRKSTRSGEPWTTTELTVVRPPGSKDPSFVARGADSKALRGSRWGLCCIDDLSNEENTNTLEAREKVYKFLSSTLLTRMDPRFGKVVVSCVAAHEDDTTHRLMVSRAEGGPNWPGLIMRSDGTILLRNCPTFDSKLIRPDDELDSSNPLATYRLVANDNRQDGEKTLWPERWPQATLDARREIMHPVEYERNYNNVCRDDTTALCKQEYVDKALALGRKMGLTKLFTSINASFKYPVFGGVDLAFSQQAAADESAIFIIGIYPDEKGKGQIRVPLWCESGKWGADELGKKLLDLDARFNHLPYGFENNGAQEGVRRLLVAADKHLVLKEHRTDATKNSIQLGVPSIFGEMANGAWAIPNEGGKVAPSIKKWLEQCLHYVPSAHTGDLLMASYFARDLAKRYGAITRAPIGAKGGRFGGGTGSLLAR